MMVYLIYEARARNYQEQAQKSAPGVENLEWHRLWEDMDKFLESCSTPTTWRFTLEQLLNPTKIMTAVRERGRDRPLERQLAAACGALAVAYRKLLGMVQHFQGKGIDENKVPDTRVTKDKANSKGQTKPMEVSPIQKRKYKTKSAPPIDDDGETGPSQATSPESEIITESLQFNSLWSLWEKVICHLNEPILSWMI
ncbi:hypothetical protein BTVI_08072 [Pitangus sulphuratus]|nr:hypothetical protein BTVI_08072 [Pitangus sulphuratus]